MALEEGKEERHGRSLFRRRPAHSSLSSWSVWVSHARDSEFVFFKHVVCIHIGHWGRGAKFTPLLHPPSPSSRLYPSLLSIFHFPLSSLSLSLSLSNAAGPYFPRAGWTVVECVLLTFTRGQETQPPGRETRERGIEREGWVKEGRERQKKTSEISLATTVLRRHPLFFFMCTPSLDWAKLRCQCFGQSKLSHGSPPHSPTSLFLHLFSLFRYFCGFGASAKDKPHNH